MFPTFKHLSDPALVHELDVAVVHERRNTAKVVALIAEVDTRKLYRAYGYPSIFQYCVGRLGLSEDEAYKRMQAAFAAQSFPVILDMLAEGRLHLTGIVRLRPHLTPENAGELIAACEHKSKREIEKLLAERFPQADVPTVILPIALMPAPNQAAVTPPPSANPATLPFGCEGPETISNGELVPEPVSPIAIVESKASMVPLDRALVKPIAPQKYALQVTITVTAHDKLRYAQELMRHQARGTSEAVVLERALDALIRELEKARFAATERPGKPRGSKNPRRVPAHVKRAVHERDGGQCTFRSASGHRCESRDVEFDHILEVARGGQATVENIRLRCRAHNLYAAEMTFGAGFMEHKRNGARDMRMAEKCSTERA